MDSGRVGDVTVGIQYLKELKRLCFSAFNKGFKPDRSENRKRCSGIVSPLLCNFKLKSTGTP
jgi:retron-type reverse transcriptase